ncbi:MAG: 50S ribosomal protein L3 [candidate division Zixibacteria bacterium]|jgi:large subunit ribosomal protein L3|nr:50S ribosomal protein L3 [candidate division Zixibacteria bacterium]
MKVIFGRKIGMTRVFTEDGESIPVTVVQAGPCPVVQVKTKESDGYPALKVAFDEIKESRCNMPMSGVFKGAGIAPHRYLREIRLDKDAEDVSVGDSVKADVFKVGDKVDVSGLSKGLGFQGTVRRHGFGGGPKTHGQSDRLRAPGSIGQSSYPSRVLKGTRMSGRMGGKKITVKNIRVVKVDPENNLICLRGAVPGKKNSFIRIAGTK